MLRFLPLLLIVALAACSGGDPEPAAPVPRPGSLELVSGAIPDQVLDGLVEFGNVTVGAARSRKVLLRNVGDLAAAVELDAPAAPFTADVAGPVEVPAGGELELVFSVLLPDEQQVEGIARLRWKGGGIDLRLRAEGAACLVQLAERVDAGAAAVGAKRHVPLVVTNAGSGMCTLESTVVEGAGFSVVERPLTQLVPGTSATVQIAFEPEAPEAHAGTLRVSISGKEYAVALAGRGVADCLRVEPAVLDFGTLSICLQDGGAEQAVTIRNECADALTWRDLWLEGDDAGRFEVSRRPSMGTTLGAGATAQVWIQVWVSHPGPLAATFRLQFEEGLEVSVPVVAAGEVSLLQASDGFFPRHLMPLDVLVVIDDTQQMQPFTGKTDAFAATLVAALDGQDFHLGVTTVSSHTTAGCRPAPNGRLLPLGAGGTRILDPDTPDLVDELAARLDVGSCQDPGRASGFAAAVRALGTLANAADDPSTPEPDDGNLGFRREEAYLLLLFVSASEDGTTVSVEDWATQLAWLAGHESFLDVQSWVPFAAGQCGGSASDYAGLTIRLGGDVHDLCETPWHAPGFIGVPPVSDTYPLSEMPVDIDGDGRITEAAGEMLVELNGIRVPETTESGEPVWIVYADSRQLRFFPGHRPRGGQTLTTTYMVECTGE